MLLVFIRILPRGSWMKEVSDVLIELRDKPRNGRTTRISHRCHGRSELKRLVPRSFDPALTIILSLMRTLDTHNAQATAGDNNQT